MPLQRYFNFSQMIEFVRILKPIRKVKGYTVFRKKVEYRLSYSVLCAYF